VIRVGLGVDAHAFDPARPLVLGGVTIPDHPGLAGHSDADVVSHAVADALLGACALGDLGTHFPDDDRWRDASSLGILGEVGRMARSAGWSVGNVDVTIIAEAPALAPHRSAMSASLAAALAIGEDSVSIKATTTDGLGVAGRGEGMAALAVVLVERTP
jgi:2-C-methyl-D-erythritol 2,4-cyclodiphosphate synthase